MKRIISVLIMAVMIAAFMMPSAFAEDGVTVTNKLASDRYEVNITCNYEEDGNVLMVVRDEEDNISAMGQSRCQGGILTGKLYLPIPVSDEKDYFAYTVYLGHSVSSDEKKAEFSLPTADFYEENVEKLKDAKSKDDVIAVIDENAYYLGLDTLFFTEDTKEEIGRKFLSLDRENLTAENLPIFFDESVIRTYIYKLKKDINAVLEHYEATLSVINGENSMYSYYDEMSDSEKKDVLSLFSSEEPEKTENIKDYFNMAVLFTALDEGTNTEVDTLLTEFQEYLGIEKPELSTTKTIKLIGELRKAEVTLEKEDFASIFEKAVKKINETKTPTGSTSGGGGASPGGGSVGAGKYTPTASENTPVLTPQKPSFIDVDNYPWAKDAIDYLFSKDVISGRAEGIFAPGENITRAEFAKILSIAYGFSENNSEMPFTDITKDHWSYKYIASLYANGITSGYPDNTFLGERNITREEIALMLYKALTKKYEMGVQESINTNLADMDMVSEYAKFAVLGLEKSGIIKGDEKLRFNPKQNATRAEVSVMIYRALQKGGEDK